MKLKDLKSELDLSSLENCEVSQKLLWDLGGQERYLASHAALMPAESAESESGYTVCMYLLVIDISKPLVRKAKSFYRLGETSSSDVSLQLLNIVRNSDFPRHWFTSICICHPSDKCSKLYLGKDLGVRYPAILIAATHVDEVEKMPNSEGFLRSQNEHLKELISKLRCEDHIVKNRENPENEQLFFRVDNTKSGRCEGVKTIKSKLDGSSEKYWSKKNKKRPMPLKWVHFELLLVTEKEEKIISVERAFEISRQSEIESNEEASSALKFIHNLGAIFYFWDVPELKQYVIVNPEWLIGTVAAFVTAKEPKKDLNKRLWQGLCDTGEISKDGALGILMDSQDDDREADDEDKDSDPVVLNVLRMLDILCDLDSSTFLIPCMVTKMLEESSVWEKYDPSQAFPPPIVIFPAEVPIIPEALFFRIVTKFARKYPKLARKLTRNRSIFRIGNNLTLELLYYDRGTCLIVSMTGEGDMDNALSSLPKSAPEIRQFVTESVEDAKKRGMSGLKLTFYSQVTKCIKTDVDDAGKFSCRLPGDDCLLQLPAGGACSPVPPDSLLYKSGKYPTKEERELVRRWYKKEVPVAQLFCS